MRNIYWIMIMTCFFLTSNAQSKSSLKLVLTFDRNEIAIMDPWDFKLDVINEGLITEKIYAFSITSGRASNYGYIALEIKTNTDTTWKNSNCILNMRKEGNNPWTLLAPGASISATFNSPPPLNDLLAGEFNVRALYAPFGVGNQTRLYSDEITVRIVNYTGNDLKAYEYLKTLRNPNFVYAPIYSISGVSDTSEVTHAEYIVRTFSASIFKGYSELFLANYYFYTAIAEVEKKTNAQIVLDYLRKSKKYGLDVLQVKDERFQESAVFVLSGQLNFVLMPLFNNRPSKALIDEFTYPPKN